MVAFFVVRILPSPFMVYKMVYGSYAAYSAFDFGLAVATTPLPFVLNSYWRAAATPNPPTTPKAQPHRQMLRPFALPGGQTS